MSVYVNPNNVPLSVAVYLATDNYDYESDAISATALIRPLRQIVLSRRVPKGTQTIDIASMLKSRMGNSIHDGIEQSWLRNKEGALRALGYPANLIERVKVNPAPGSLRPGDIPVYLEQRSRRTIGGRTVSGKFDFVAEGRVEDFKSTGTFTWTNVRAGKQKESQYQLQGSMYRWLNPEIVTENEIAINFLFTDWMAGFVNPDTNYPKAPIARKLIPLLSIPETENWVRNKLDAIDQYMDAPESEIPRCTDEELWRTAPVYKYYKNPAKRTRSTKNFDDYTEAYQKLMADGGVGVVIEAAGTVNACKYCPAFGACTQKDELIAAGDLRL